MERGCVGLVYVCCYDVCVCVCECRLPIHTDSELTRTHNVINQIEYVHHKTIPYDILCIINL